jgi:hypothetical protein
MPLNTRSAKAARPKPNLPTRSPTLQGTATPKQKQNNAPGSRKENCPVVNSGEIIEISSDEDEAPTVAPNLVTASKLKERIRVLEQVCLLFRGS